jgi:hypothetical protein
MAEIITNTTLDNFQRLTSYDIKTFFQNYLQFVDVEYANITNFFSGVTKVVPTDSIYALHWLIKEQKKIVDVTILNSSSLNSYDYWILVENVEDIGHVLETASNASKWLRSSISANGYKQQVQIDLVASQGENLEMIERNKLRSNNPNDSWVQTALDNGLREEDYSSDGNYLLKVVYQNNASLFLNSVVDNIDTPEKTYGLDVKKEIEWQDSDLVVLDYKDTIFQSAQVLSNLLKEDDPAFPTRGMNKKSIGSNIAAVSYPILFRDLASSFASDDSFKSFSINNIRREQDAIFIDFTVETKAGSNFSRSSQL